MHTFIKLAVAASRSGRLGDANRLIDCVEKVADASGARTDTFLGARYRRIVKRRGHAKAPVAVARSLLVITWHLINNLDPFRPELGAEWHQRHLSPAPKTRGLVRQLQALGRQVTLEPVSA
ncbi:hypothetical protein [Streptomyces sp. KMM 9044]|uniref:hypothetical protein n=1 Tax=Streptomyces sp. KMM 9044 TaxID=2744474 RepID=UPI002151FB80|nr:hypothetical protein [Streptomyces sp. KMM 9044]WAX80213.1 hypothetical protein HUV60_023705 [Streptomyces sp. KMM 9044]